MTCTLSATRYHTFRIFLKILIGDDECGLENVKEMEQKIVGGTEAKEHQFPWMVGTEVDGFIFCGASLISNSLYPT